MSVQHLFDKLWQHYTEQNPSVLEIYNLFQKEGEEVFNDHIALRTLAGPEVGIETLSKSFVAGGYVEKQDYDFEMKKLSAKHYEHSDPKMPKVFISELRWQEFSPNLQSIMQEVLSKLTPDMCADPGLSYSGRAWDISYEVYKSLREESEYAAWFYVFGFQANHFTVNVNLLQKYDTLGKVNDFISSNGFELNASGGVIKGSPEELLEQSSTMAKSVLVEFSDGAYSIPACYYEFAKRYADENGKIYHGFIAKSADKIFESTDNR